MKGNILGAATNSFTTYFGSTIHGLKVVWNSSPSEDQSGTTEIEIEFTEYLKSNLHIFGYEATNTAYTDVGNVYTTYNSVGDDTALTATVYGL